MTAGRHGAAESRRTALLALVRDRGRLEVAGLPAELGVSAETVRRDLAALEEQGRVRRSYGTAYAVESGGFETGLDYRAANRIEEKRRIAAAAVRELGDASTIYLDEGHQTQLIAESLPRDAGLSVVTPSLVVAQAVAAVPGTSCIILGGSVRGTTMGVVGSWAESMLRTLSVDLAFIGANGISDDGALTTPDPAVAAIKGAAIAGARRRILVGAHHKFGNTTFVRFAGIDEFDRVITGRELPERVAARMAGLGTELIRA